LGLGPGGQDEQDSEECGDVFIHGVLRMSRIDADKILPKPSRSPYSRLSRFSVFLRLAVAGTAASLLTAPENEPRIKQNVTA
jgi:hypothetical protein